MQKFKIIGVVYEGSIDESVRVEITLGQGAADEKMEEGIQFRLTKRDSDSTATQEFKERFGNLIEQVNRNNIINHSII